MKKTDIILILSILLSASVLAISLYAFRQPPSIVRIYVNNQLQQELPLDTDSEYLINSQNGISNLLIIEDGKAYVKDATCPDKICVQMGKISELTQIIVCIPNNVVIVIESDDL